MRAELARSSSVRGIPPQETAGILPVEDASEHQRPLWFRRLASANQWKVVWPSVLAPLLLLSTHPLNLAIPINDSLDVLFAS